MSDAKVIFTCACGKGLTCADNWNEGTCDTCMADAALGRALRQKWPAVTEQKILDVVDGAMKVLAENRHRHLWFLGKSLTRLRGYVYD